MRKTSKRTLYDIIIGISIGIVVAFTKYFFELTTTKVILLYVSLFVLAFVVLFIIGLLRAIKINAEFNDAVKNLFQKQKYEEFIQKILQLQEKAVGDNFVNLCKMNLGAAYCRMGEYEKGIEQILSVPDNNKFPKVNKAVNKNNLCTCYFYDGQIDKAIETYRMNEDLFNSFRDHEKIGKMIMVLDIYYLIYIDERDKAAKMLQDMKEKYPLADLQYDYDKLEKLLSDNTLGL